MTDGHTTMLTADGRDGTAGPYGSRLLHGWYATGGPAGLDQHLGRYGPPPHPRSAGAADRLVRAVEDAGLTGRGGAAFPTARKLRTVAGGKGTAVVVANGMESEPASRKDETLLDLAPHLVLDGAALAAATVGADVAHLCLPRTRQDQADALREAVAERRRLGLDPVPVEVHELPHHYVSSEETSLVRWLNGGDARPLATPPRPFDKGVGRRPTLIDNVETLAHLALIARYGPGWFRGAGGPDAAGTTLVTLSGALRTPGVYEVPMGLTLGGMLDVAGGADEPLGALLLGGFFGSWLPVGQALRVPFAKPDLASLGAGPGAGVLVALPARACGLAETARVLGYLAAQSARQCGPCRLGLPAVAEDFADLAWGRPDPWSLRRLESRAGLLAGRGACRHPDGASRFAATALRVFADDVLHHLSSGPCAAAGHEPVLPVPGTPAPDEPEWR
ncbi:NADH-ubiquinone oxidoreductase-F iron-sulfur binding region domain-containing protein [Streptomyces sp. Li-HN-5-11]|uniref:NADH-ubiquinone oxidoreductase-F iron-sulfur binding region domain-containing protein n=1 Tax=Streptomyces sp. Li-HN-5-11 TaxID=3075432 RepID=UPI0028AFB0C1|nr:NADH-ubiquinone oxidoreductase-F iron-sulfur binding region domain-containing protein [Streptomyces sp. Li-HN-5-11]WNM35836.1 NADH-ubiquinone oxidoreductase-F iron-sulfur binding region domain-containing protein [Streptomyces sp. Li-HN-5-11]